MSRPFRFVLPAVFLAGALGISGCVGTLYDDTYSYNKTHFKPPKEKKDATADAILGALDKPAPATGGDAGAGGLPPAGDVPGLPAAGVPGLPEPGAPAVPPPAAPPPNN